MAKATNPRKRELGSIDELPSGALRVRVYAGVDPITKRRHDLVKVVPAGPNAWDQADDVRRDFLVQIKERRNPKTTATIDELLDCYLDQHQGGSGTVTGYRDYVDKHPADAVLVDGVRERDLRPFRRRGRPRPRTSTSRASHGT